MGGGGGAGATLQALEDDDCGGEEDDDARLTDERFTHDRMHASAAAHAQLHAESLLRRSGMDVGAPTRLHVAAPTPLAVATPTRLQTPLAPHHASFSPEHKVDVDTPFRHPITYRENEGESESDSKRGREGGRQAGRQAGREEGREEGSIELTLEELNTGVDGGVQGDLQPCPLCCYPGKIFLFFLDLIQMRCCRCGVPIVFFSSLKKTGGINRRKRQRMSASLS